MDKNNNLYHVKFANTQNPIILNDLELLSLGRIFCTPHTFYDDHYHKNWFELTFVTDGKGTIFTNNVPTKVKKGDIYLSYAHDIHKIKVDPNDPLKYDYFAFYPVNNILSNKLNQLITKNTNPKKRVFNDDKLFLLISNAIKEFKTDDIDYRNLIINSIFVQIILNTIKNFEANIQSDTTLTSSEILCFQIMDYISSNLYELTSLSKLSDIFSYSYNYLSYVFKKTTSFTLIEYYNMLRLEEVKKLLINQNYNLTEIADKLNFSTSFSLSKAFKQKYNISPMQYKKQKINK